MDAAPPSEVSGGLPHIAELVDTVDSTRAALCADGFLSLGNEQCHLFKITSHSAKQLADKPASICILAYLLPLHAPQLRGYQQSGQINKLAGTHAENCCLDVFGSVCGLGRALAVVDLEGPALGGILVRSYSTSGVI